MSPADDYEEFAAATGRALRRTAYLMCGDWQRAEDATQDALVKLYVAWPRLARRGVHAGLRTYAHRAVTTAVIDQSRRPWRREVVGDDVPEDVRRSVADPTSSSDQRLAVIAALQTLPPRRRACVVLRYFADMSVAETAEALGVETGTVKSQTARGLDQLRQVLVAGGLDLALEDQ